MKIKKFRIYRPEIQVEIMRPILGRLVFAYNLPKFIRFASLNLKIQISGRSEQLKRIYVLVVPKFEITSSAEGVKGKWI